MSNRLRNAVVGTTVMFGTLSACTAGTPEHLPVQSTSVHSTPQAARPPRHESLRLAEQAYRRATLRSALSIIDAANSNPARLEQPTTHRESVTGDLFIDKRHRQIRIAAFAGEAGVHISLREPARGIATLDHQHPGTLRLALLVRALRAGELRPRGVAVYPADAASEPYAIGYTPQGEFAKGYGTNFSTGNLIPQFAEPLNGPNNLNQLDDFSQTLRQITHAVTSH